jgi:hypothetical protein
VVGSRGGADKLPRRLRGLAVPAVAGDGAALMEAVSKVGQDNWGREWVSRGERELARAVGKVR